MNKLKSIQTIALALVGLTGSSHAVTALVDFASATPTPATAQGGNFWTGVDTNSPTNLLATTDGSDTGWDITVTWVTTTAGYGGNGINGNGDVAPFDQSFAIIDGIFSSRNNSFVTITLTNLSPNSLYDFVAYTDRATNWSPGNGLIDTTVGTGPTGLVTLKDSLTSFSITANGAGTAAFTFVEGGNDLPIPGDGVVLNALSITQIPEPSSLGLIGMVGGSFLIRRRRTA